MPLPILAVGGILGGLQFGSSMLAGISQTQQYNAQATLQQMQAQNANFQRQWQINANNRAISRQNLNRSINNKLLEGKAVKEKALQEVYSKLGYDNSKSQFSKQTNQINSALLSSVSGRNISSSSGTAKALLRQNLLNAKENMINLRVNYANKMRDIDTAYDNMLAQRDFNYQEVQIYLPGDTSLIQGNTSSIIAQSALSGLQAGIQGGLLYGSMAGNGSDYIGDSSGTTPFDSRAGLNDFNNSNLPWAARAGM